MTIRRFRPPLFLDAPGIQVVCALQLRLPLADRLGVAAEEAGDVLDPAMADLRGLDGRIAPPILLTQGIEQPGHHPLELRRVTVHAILLVLHSVRLTG